METLLSIVSVHGNKEKDVKKLPDALIKTYNPMVRDDAFIRSLNLDKITELMKINTNLNLLGLTIKVSLFVDDSYG